MHCAWKENRRSFLFVWSYNNRQFSFRLRSRGAKQRQKEQVTIGRDIWEISIPGQVGFSRPVSHERRLGGVVGLVRTVIDENSLGYEKVAPLENIGIMNKTEIGLEQQMEIVG